MFLKNVVKNKLDFIFYIKKMAWEEKRSKECPTNMTSNAYEGYDNVKVVNFLDKAVL